MPDSVSIAAALHDYETAEQHLLGQLVAARVDLDPEHPPPPGAVMRFADATQGAWRRLFRELDVDVAATGEVTSGYSGF